MTYANSNACKPNPTRHRPPPACVYKFRCMRKLKAAPTGLDDVRSADLSGRSARTARRGPFSSTCIASSAGISTSAGSPHARCASNCGTAWAGAFCSTGAVCWTDLRCSDACDLEVGMRRGGVVSDTFAFARVDL